ncbi:hypothetical protein TWF696_001810 [Orbilia brochopaga]|uniref:Uncharacterized protein n=1 Tax=Orbilia brochopaga TaxID=3140254 RepID=A0AAV9U7H7_9PEZI
MAQTITAGLEHHLSRGSLKTEYMVYTTFYDVFHEHEKLLDLRASEDITTIFQGEDMAFRFAFCCDHGVSVGNLVNTLRKLLIAGVFHEDLELGPTELFRRLYLSEVRGKGNPEDGDPPAQHRPSWILGLEDNTSKISLEPSEASTFPEELLEKLAQLSCSDPPRTTGPHVEEETLDVGASEPTMEKPQVADENTKGSTVGDAGILAVDRAAPNFLEVYLSADDQRFFLQEALVVIWEATCDYLIKFPLDQYTLKKLQARTLELKSCVNLIEKEFIRARGPDPDGACLREILYRAVLQLENIAVTDGQIPAKQLQILFAKAVSFCHTLKDKKRQQGMKTILQLTKLFSMVMLSRKLRLHRELAGKLDPIEDARQKLKEKEQEAVKAALQADSKLRESRLCDFY